MCRRRQTRQPPGTAVGSAQRGARGCPCVGAHAFELDAPRLFQGRERRQLHGGRRVCSCQGAACPARLLHSTATAVCRHCKASVVGAIGSNPHGCLLKVHDRVSAPAAEPKPRAGHWCVWWPVRGACARQQSGRCRTACWQIWVRLCPAALCSGCHHSTFRRACHDCCRLQPAFGPPRPLVSAAPDPPASAAFPLLPLLQLGPQTHAQPPATAAPPGRLDSTREDFWMGQVRGLPRPLQCLPCI